VTTRTGLDECLGWPNPYECLSSVLALVSSEWNKGMGYRFREVSA
jgi:hypothetical protein